MLPQERLDARGTRLTLQQGRLDARGLRLMLQLLFSRERCPSTTALAEQGDGGIQSTRRRKDSGDKAQIPGGSPCKG